MALSALVRGRIGIGAAGTGLAERATEVECARMPHQKAATPPDRGDRCAEPEAVMANAYGTRLAHDVIREAVQIHDAVGFAR